MASSTAPLLSSSPSSITDLQQQQWLSNSIQAFSNHLHLDTDLPICIFQLPQTLTSEQQHWYTPHHIGLGPIHHFRSDLYSKQHQLKITTPKSLLKPHKFTSQFHRILHEKLTHLVPVARCCYDLYFDINDQCLAWVFFLDALFLLDLLSKVTDTQMSSTSIMADEQLLDDVIMVENQVPLVILVQLLNALNQHSSNDVNTFSLSNLLVKLCENRSPLRFTLPETELDHLDISNSYHLLDCLYNLIINHRLPPKNPYLRMNFLLDVHLEDVENAVQIAGELFPGVNAVLQPVLLVLKLPWDKIGTWIKKVMGENPTLLEIDIPSVSKLESIGKIEFVSSDGGIRDIKFDEETETPSITLPVLDLKPGSEVVLRNLVAYEQSMFEKGNIKNVDFTEYMEFMCGIIDDVKDVKILREKNIIEGDMGDEEIVKMFNGMSNSSVKTDGMVSELQKTVVKVDKYFGDLPRVRVVNFVKKVFVGSWKTMAILFSVLSLVMMIVSGVCQVYDCKGHFGLGGVRLAVL